MSLVCRNLCYSYPMADRPAVDDVTIGFKPGELVLLTGPTGCGKSTLLRLLAGLLRDDGGGTVSGEVCLDGADVSSMLPSTRVKKLGFVSQVPGDQLVAGTIADEVAFGLESAGFAIEEIDARVLVALNAVGLDLAQNHPCLALSGGQMQRLVLAAAIGGSPGVLLLDEPLAQLDGEGAIQLLDALAQIAARGVAVVMVEHRVHLLREWAQRILVMDGGKIIGSGADALARLGLGEPLKRPTKPDALGRCLLKGSGLSHRYEGNRIMALDGVDFELFAGERVAIMGPNGSGKSTLLKVLSGDFKAKMVTGDCTVIDVPQDPDLALFCTTVRDELSYAAVEARWSHAACEERVNEVAVALNLTAFLDCNPQGLSRGQRLRVAVGAAMVAKADVLLLDEPTSGQDRREVARLISALATMAEDGAVVFATHDEGLAQAAATRIVRMDGGKIVAVETP